MATLWMVVGVSRPRPGGAHKQQRAAQGKNGSRTLEPSRRWHREPEGLSGGQCTIGA